MYGGSLSNANTAENSEDIYNLSGDKSQSNSKYHTVRVFTDLTELTTYSVDQEEV
jgi:hypothetical protein